LQEKAREWERADARAAASREKRSAWGGKRVKTLEGSIVFVEPSTLLERIAAAGIAAGDEDFGQDWLADAADVPCEVHPCGIS